MRQTEVLKSPKLHVFFSTALVAFKKIFLHLPSQQCVYIEFLKSYLTLDSYHAIGASLTQFHIFLRMNSELHGLFLLSFDSI